MDLIYAVIFLVIVGVALELLKTKLPIDPVIRVAIQVLIVIAVVLWLLRRFPVPNFF